VCYYPVKSIVSGIFVISCPSKQVRLVFGLTSDAVVNFVNHGVPIYHKLEYRHLLGDSERT
jgi:hypothetical protein